MHICKNKICILAQVFLIILTSFDTCSSTIGSSRSRNGRRSKWSTAMSAFSILLRRGTSVISKNSNDVRFLLYSNFDQPDEAEEIIFGDRFALARSNFDSYKPVILIVHGFLSNNTIVTGVKKVKDAYLAKRIPANIIMVDHMALTSPDLPYSFLSPPFYFQAGRNVPKIGQRLAKFILFLIKTEAIGSAGDVHIIGQSIGAHIAGIAGREIMKKTGHQIQRITGLDPAGPMYQTQWGHQILDKTDARFVDITHTNQWIYGMIGSIGDVDFYVNGGGPFQPRDTCRHVPGEDSDQEAYCSHIASVIYFAESIKHPNYIACKCRKCRNPPKTGCKDQIIYGHYTPIHAHGDYYVNFKL